MAAYVEAVRGICGGGGGVVYGPRGRLGNRWCIAHVDAGVRGINARVK